jgi:hypothetical protein
VKQTLALAEWSAVASGTQELLCKFGGRLFAGIDRLDRAAVPRMFKR